MTKSSGGARSEVREEFTFRAHGRSISTSAVVDTGAENTFITAAIVEALGVDPLGSTLISYGDGQGESAQVYRCSVSWALYEDHGYSSDLEVHCIPGEEHPLIGMDFLEPHKLRVDTEHRALVGRIPGPGAVPLLGGSFVVNPPPGFVKKRNQERLARAKSGEVLRHHPAWRFTRPDVVKK